MKIETELQMKWSYLQIVPKILLKSPDNQNLWLNCSKIMEYIRMSNIPGKFVKTG